MSAREHISLRTKLASALLALGHVPYEDSKLMTADQICSLYAFDHYPIRHADGGVSEPWNLVPRLILAHREKTAKKDAPEMAKDRPIIAAHTNHVDRMQAKISGRPVEEQPRSARKIPSRPFGKKPHRSFRGKNAWARV